MTDELIKYRNEMYRELQNILAFWNKYTVDQKYGGFVGKIDNDNKVDETAPKGSVLNSRILWSFSAAYNLTKNPQYLQMAERAFKYIRNYFIDKEFGGVYWTVDFNGKPLDTKKQIYALSFVIYGLSEYAKAAESEEAKQSAIELYKTMVRYSHDNIYGGYIEALTRDWKPIEDLRLSAKDANEKKSMNTHLHVLEGFGNLYKVWPDKELKVKITELIHLFLDHIIDNNTNNLVLFFDNDWSVKSNILSYGHDIEAAWLVQEAAEIIGDEALGEQVKARSVKIADAASKGLDEDGGLWYEFDVATNHLVAEKHWWPQAEAMVGYFNAWQVSGNNSYQQKSINSWEFIKKHIIDQDKGEWYWGVSKNYIVMKGQDKVGLWKCPYHNTRACLEIIHRIEE